jgi:hypothetical protein
MDSSFRWALSAFGTDQAGNLYLGGTTTSQDFPVTPNAFQPNYEGSPRSSFMLKLSSDGKTLKYGTYLGGSNSDKNKGNVRKVGRRGMAWRFNLFTQFSSN